MTELLSPAGGREALAAAVQNGADAVYMGFGSFNARRSARNFSDEEFLAAVRYCHLWGVKVYLTLNTLVTDRELPALAETARRFGYHPDYLSAALRRETGKNFVELLRGYRMEQAECLLRTSYMATLTEPLIDEAVEIIGSVLGEKV